MSSPARLPLIRRLLGRPARILHAPWNVGGHPGGLSRAERELGLVSDVLVLEQHPYGYPADIDLQIPAAIHGRPEYPGIVREATEKLVNRYDVFHFNFGQTIMQVLDEELKLHTELPRLKEAGKTILVTFQGDDARPPEANPVVNYTETDLEQIKILQDQRRDAMLRYADRVFYLPPDLKQWLPGESSVPTPTSTRARSSRCRRPAAMRSSSFTRPRTGRRREPSTSSPRSMASAQKGCRCGSTSSKASSTARRCSDIPPPTSASTSSISAGTAGSQSR